MATKPSPKRVKDFKITLKALEPYIKNPKHLHNGRPFDDFSLRPREFRANWLLCVTLKHIYGDDITFMEDDKGDGILIDKGMNQYIRTEHVAAMDFPHTSLPQGDYRILQAIEQKIQAGSKYHNQVLIIFFDGVGSRNPNEVSKTIANKHAFFGVYCIGLEKGDDSGYSYIVAQLLNDGNSIVFRVEINADFTDYIVYQPPEVVTSP